MVVSDKSLVSTGLYLGKQLDAFIAYLNMVLAFWIQYPLGRRLSWEIISDRIRVGGFYYLFDHIAVVGTILSLVSTQLALKFYSYPYVCVRFYREKCPASQPRHLRISFLIIYSIINVFFLPVWFSLLIFAITVLTVLIVGIAVVFIVWLFVLLASFVVWLLLYRIPVYDLVYPRIGTWMLQHNSAIYNRLPPGADIFTSYIRLVRISPGSVSQILECELITENIATADFDALSYVWGITLFPYKIRVNGSDFYVTYNLFTALRELRRPDRDRVVWIDALCINQSDDVEKSSQVRLMKTIYSKASEVIVWLGTGSKATTATFSFVRQFSDARTEEDCNYLWAKITASWGSRCIRMELGRILSHEWWTRAWIIQEVAVARHVLVQRGPAQLDWDVIQPLFRYGPFQEMFQLQSSIEFADEVQQLRNELSFDSPSPTTIFDLVYRFRHQFATLGSDKIYAILGLLPSNYATAVSPDYSKSTEQVFLDFTLASLAEDKTFAVVAIAPGAALRGVSWCRDWRILNDGFGFSPAECFSMYEWPSMMNYCAAGDSEPCFEANMSRRVLRVKGFDLDVIARGGEHTLTLSNPPGIHLLSSLLLSWERTAGGPWSLSSEEGLASSKSFNRTIVADRWAEGIVDWKTEIEVSDSNVGPEDDSYAKTISRVGINRRFFVTQKGRFGLGPLDLKKGDILVAVLGSVVPLLLRKDTKCKEPEEEFWTVIGEAYCDGVMYYEGDIDKDIHDGKVKIRDYNLR